MMVKQWSETGAACVSVYFLELWFEQELCVFFLSQHSQTPLLYPLLWCQLLKSPSGSTKPKAFPGNKTQVLQHPCWFL